MQLYFRKVFGTIFLTKVAQIYFYSWVHLKNVTIKIKTNAVIFGQILEKIGLLLILSSGYTAAFQIVAVSLSGIEPESF